MPEALAKDVDYISHSWTLDSLRDHLLGLMTAHDQRYWERNTAIVDLIKSNDGRYQQVFDSSQRAVDTAFAVQQRAIDTAFTAQQTGLNAALLAQKEAVFTALVAAEKAVNAALVSSAQAVQKAETAAERRFESVNEFRQTLSDQQRTLMPRPEIEVLIRSLQNAIDTNKDTLREQGSLVARFIATKEGQHSGLTSGWQAAGAVIIMVSILLSIFNMFHK